MIVSLGVSQHLAACLDSLASHDSRDSFRVVWVNNDPGAEPSTAPALPDEVLRVDVTSNLGWAGGLHVGRAHLDSEYLVWVQDDMQVSPGWLDALMTAADAHPDIAAFGSLAMLDDGRLDGPSGGRALPHDDVARWNDHDAAAGTPPTELTRHDWVTGKGMLTRVAAWDEVHGTDPRQFPLNHVDKDYFTHLRAHGYSVALVPGARLTHVGSASSPSQFRLFLPPWQEPRFNARWGGPVAAMDAAPGPVAHECSAWLPEPSDPARILEHVRRAVGDEASRMLIPAVRWTSSAHLKEVEDRAHAFMLVEIGASEQRFVTSASWRVTAPLRAAAELLRRLRRSGR